MMGMMGRRPVILAALSILAFMVWLVFILVYALFWSNGFTTFQNVIVTIVSFLVTVGAVGIMWMLFAMKLWGRNFPKPAEG